MKLVHNLIYSFYESTYYLHYYFRTLNAFNENDFFRKLDKQMLNFNKKNQLNTHNIKKVGKSRSY